MQRSMFRILLILEVFLALLFLTRYVNCFVPRLGMKTTTTSCVPSNTCNGPELGFPPPSVTIHTTISTSLAMSQGNVSEKEAKVNIDKVVAALRKDQIANNELGRLEKVTVVVGYGTPSPGVVAVRFNAQFRKNTKGYSAIPLPFGLGQSNVSEGRGTMVGQVKASINATSGKIISCSVFRDLGYGRAFNLKI